MYGVAGFVTVGVVAESKPARPPVPPTVSVLSFVVAVYSTLLMGFEVDMHHPSGGVCVNAIVNCRNDGGGRKKRTVLRRRRRKKKWD